MSDTIIMPEPKSLEVLQQCHSGMVQRFVDSVHFLHRQFPTRWQIGGYEPNIGWTALFVGRYYVIGLMPNDYSLLVNPAAAEAANTQLLSRLVTQSWERLARIRFGDEDVDAVLTTFGPAHEVGLQLAARSGGGRPEPPRHDMWASVALVASSLPRTGRR